MYCIEPQLSCDKCFIKYMVNLESFSLYILSLQYQSNAHFLRLALLKLLFYLFLYHGQLHKEKISVESTVHMRARVSYKIWHTAENVLE